jgi:hypothetical protein
VILPLSVTGVLAVALERSELLAILIRMPFGVVLLAVIVSPDCVKKSVVVVQPTYPLTPLIDPTRVVMEMLLIFSKLLGSHKPRWMFLTPFVIWPHIIISGVVEYVSPGA